MKNIEHDHHKNRTFWDSMKLAFWGLWMAFRSERNLHIQLTAAVLVLAVSLKIHVSETHLMIILILIGGVISLELMNTALERLVDLVTKEWHPLAKAAKDIAAGAVWWFSIISAVIYILILHDTLK